MALDLGSGYVADFHSRSSDHDVFLWSGRLLRYRHSFVTDVCALCVPSSLFLFERVYALCVRGDAVLSPSPRNLMAFLTGPVWIFCERNRARGIYGKVRSRK